MPVAIWNGGFISGKMFSIHIVMYKSQGRCWWRRILAEIMDKLRELLCPHARHLFNTTWQKTFSYIKDNIPYYWNSFHNQLCGKLLNFPPERNPVCSLGERSDTQLPYGSLIPFSLMWGFSCCTWKFGLLWWAETWVPCSAWVSDGWLRLPPPVLQYWQE